MELSDIQKQILSNLLKSNGLRYSQARPPHTENDLYNYHLKFLVGKNFVKKEDNVYLLTNKGKEYVQQMDSLGNVQPYFKVSVICHVVKIDNQKLKILLQKRKRHPYYGEVYGGIAGKVHIGEAIETAARRKFKEETGLTCDFTFIGVVRKIRRNKQKEVIEDTLYHYCYGENPTGTLRPSTPFGENFWGTFKDAFEHQSKNLTASKYSDEVLKRIQKKNLQLFYFNEDLTLLKY